MASLVLCLLADWLLARAGVAVFPATKGYAHFQFGDYAKLTIIGVLIAYLLVRVAPVREAASHGRADGRRYEYGARHH